MTDSGAPSDRRLRIAALLTCHNRRETTLNCLRDLKLQVGIDAYELRVCLVDDGSTDGTSDAVRREFPWVDLIQGDGTLYWNGGMRRAMAHARELDPDFHLWLNDDTRLYPDAISRLLDAFSALAADADPPPIVIGSLKDPQTGELTYGGSRRTSRWHPLRFSRIHPGEEAKPCDVFNGNLVLVHREAAEMIGNLNPDLVHVAGDYDYALRAGKKGVGRWIAPHFFGECSRNPVSAVWSDPEASLGDRYRRMLGVKGQPPGPRLVYYRSHGGPFWFLLYPLVYLRPLFASLGRRLKKR